MKRRRAGVVLIVFGVLLAALVGGGVYVLAQRAEAPPVEETSMVVVAMAPIDERTLISATAVGMLEVPTKIVPRTALKRLDDAVGKMALSDMFPGDWVLSDRIADTQGRSGMSFVLEPGYVAMTFPLSDIIPTGAIRPGDYIDLLITLDTTKDNPVIEQVGLQPEPVDFTQMTVQNLRVLNANPTALIATQATTGQAAAQTTGQTPAQAIQHIIFSIPRQDALVLKHFKDSGAKIELVLRPAGDDQIYTTEAVFMRSLIERYRISAP